MMLAKSVAVEMYQREVLSIDELESIQNRKNQTEAASDLLSILLQTANDDTFNCFLEALKATGQQHIFLWISNPGK